MTVIVQTRGMKATAALKKFIEDQSHKVQKYAKNIGSISVYLDTLQKKKNEKGHVRVMYKVDLPGKDVVVEKKGFDMYSTVIEAMGVVEKQLRRIKEMRIGGRRTGKQANGKTGESF